MDLDYNSCAQFLARLDADAENNNNNENSSASPGDHSSLSPFDARNSASPPDLSSSSATSHSPESPRFEYDVPGWNTGDPAAFFDALNDSASLLANGDNWDGSLLPTDQQTPLEGPVVSPMSDYIKIEHDSPGGYFGGPPQTISPGNSLINPNAQTALEGGYTFGKENDGMFGFSGFNPNQANAPEFSSPMVWQNQINKPNARGSSSHWQGQQSIPQTPAQQMPPQPPQQRQVQVQQSTTSQRTSLSPSAHSHRTTSSPEAHSHSDDNSPAPRPKKRKTSTNESPNESSNTNGNGTRKQPKKTAHNMIEKRYRTNLNDKIAALRDSVPSLRVMAGTSKLNEDDDDEDLEGLAPAHKLNKATVLAKATEYIRHLEKRNKRLQDENEQLKIRLSAFEKLATMGGSMTGMDNGGRGGSGAGPGANMFSRLMVGSLAGLMVANGFHEKEESSGRQLFAMPVTLLETLGIPVTPSVVAGNQMFWLIFKLLLLISAVVFVVIPGCFDSKRKPDHTKARVHQQSKLSAVPSLASPLEVRRQAWLTAIQTVWVPHHSIFLELAALGLKAVKLSVRKLVGWQRYAMVTGMTEEHELARVKAWAIALDAQLAGGDATINHKRLILTFLASLTLPATPARLMLNAMHIRVLFSDFGAGFERFAETFAGYYWNEAKKLQQKAGSENDLTAEVLPEHLVHLLEFKHTEVFDRQIVQKAHNIAYNKGTRDNCDGNDSGMDTVVEDGSIRSPLDALAAWYSSLVLQGVFVASLKSKVSDALRTRIEENLDIALRVAPPLSAAQLRAFAAKAVLDKDNGEKYLLIALKTFEEDIKSQGMNATNIPSVVVTSANSAVTCTTDIRIALRCGMALALMKKGSRSEALQLFSDLDWRHQASGNAKNGLGLLGFIACWKTLTYFVASDKRWAADASDSVDRAAAMLRIWIGDKKIPKKADVSREDCKRVIDFCNSLQKQLAGFSDDADDGYVSGSCGARLEKTEVRFLKQTTEEP
jgi:hypothetical protein